MASRTAVVILRRGPMALFSVSLGEILFTVNLAAVFICVCCPSLMNGRDGFSFLSI